MRRRGGFTLMELLVVMSIISVLAALGYPAVIHGTRQFMLIQCLGQIRKVGQGTLQYFQEASPEKPHRMSASQWVSTLERYGVRPSNWICPVHRRHEPDADPRQGIDYMYTGMSPSVIREGVALGARYVWVEKAPNHGGLHACFMADGRAAAQDLTKIGR